jgi:hypothetical protein
MLSQIWCKWRPRGIIGTIITIVEACHGCMILSIGWAGCLLKWQSPTGFSIFFRSKGFRLDRLVICGCNFPNCPRTSIYEASERDFRIVLARDSISGLYDKGIEEMRNIGVSVMFSEDIISNLKTLCAKWYILLQSNYKVSREWEKPWCLTQRVFQNSRYMASLCLFEVIKSDS